MTEKFRNRYRIPSSRLSNWDYSTHAAYFITICTAGHDNYFGVVVPGLDDVVPGLDDVVPGLDDVVPGLDDVETPCMASLRHVDSHVDPPGSVDDQIPIVSSRWYVNLSELGKIVESEWLKTPEIRPDMNLILGNFVVMPDHFHAIIIIGSNEYNQHDTNGGGKFGPQRKNLGSIIRGFKSAVTTYAKKNNIIFGWQERFHDRVIRNEQEYKRISHYIETNPEKWMDGHDSHLETDNNE